MDSNMNGPGKDPIAIASVNMRSLNHIFRKDFINMLEKIEENSNIATIVLKVETSKFSLGFTEQDYLSGDIFLSPTLLDITSFIRNMSKRVIAAFDGNVCGAVLEIALACHYRVASANSMLGFPEIRFGLIPFGGGTQRLPSVIGLQNAINLISSGRNIDARKAHNIHLIDAIVNSSNAALMQYAKQIVKDKTIPQQVYVKSNDPTPSVDIVSKDYVRAKTSAIKIVMYSPYNSVERGIQLEQEMFGELYHSQESKALFYVAECQRNLFNWKATNTNIKQGDAKPLPIKKAGVIGLGTMGRGIAISFLFAGIPLIVMEMNKQALVSAIKTMHNIIDQAVARGIISSDQNAKMKAMMSGTTDVKDFHNCDFVIEAVFELFKIKKDLFMKLDKYCKPETILASNTSALNIDEIAAVTKRPHKVMGCHFFAPAHIMKLLENVYGEKTNAETLATGMHLGKLMGKVTVLTGNCTGFVGNRMYVNYIMECDYMLKAGLYPEEVDEALENYGFVFGRYQVADLSGIDVMHFVFSNLGYIKDGISAPGGDVTNLMHKHKRVGQKVGAGFYDYDKDAPTKAKKSPFIHNMLVELRKERNCVAEHIPPHEILERALYSLINEGFKILEDGIVSSAMDVDMVWLHGYTWPKETGGPMFYASTIGLKHVYGRIVHYNKYFADEENRSHWKPSKLLMFLASLDKPAPIHKWVDMWNKSKM